MHHPTLELLHSCALWVPSFHLLPLKSEAFLFCSLLGASGGACARKPIGLHISQEGRPGETRLGSRQVIGRLAFLFGLEDWILGADRMGSKTIYGGLTSAEFPLRRMYNIYRNSVFIARGCREGCAFGMTTAASSTIFHTTTHPSKIEIICLKWFQTLRTSDL